MPSPQQKRRRNVKATTNEFAANHRQMAGRARAPNTNGERLGEKMAPAADDKARKSSNRRNDARNYVDARTRSRNAAGWCVGSAEPLPSELAAATVGRVKSVRTAGGNQPAHDDVSGRRRYGE